jgi:hypothetical protein
MKDGMGRTCTQKTQEMRDKYLMKILNEEKTRGARLRWKDSLILKHFLTFWARKGRTFLGQLSNY